MGDYLRLAMFDKYFKPLGTQNPQGPGGQGYESAHYLMSWYYSWGGNIPAGNQGGWSWRIGSSHCHFGYQNPVAAWVLSNVPAFQPPSANGVTDWATSFDRQMEFYQYLQSAQGPISGGVTNSWNGDYSPHPTGKSTFYAMAFDDNPVYEDPGSNTWPGFQGWSMERIAELYYLNNDQRAKALMDKWAPWVISEIQLIGDNDFMIPATFEWTGEPDVWGGAPSANTGLTVQVTDYGRDLGVTASFARTLIYYAAATEKYDVLDEASRDMAKELLDRMWTSYKDDKGLSAPEGRGDYTRFFEQEVYVPAGFSGTMANGDLIEPGVSFFDIRSQYANDPMFADLQASYNAGEEFTVNYHRSWAQIEIALANAEFGLFFGDAQINKKPVVAITSPADSSKYTSDPVDIAITATATDEDGTVSQVEFFLDGVSIGVDLTAPYSATALNVSNGTYQISAVATDDAGATSTDVISISVGNSPPIAAFSASSISGLEPLTVDFDASASSDPDNDPLTYSWDFGDGSTGVGVLATHTFASQGTYDVTLTVSDGNGGVSTATQQIEVLSSSCDLLSFFGVPRTTGLPSIENASYNEIHVLGTGGPDLSNMSNFTINWANESWGSGLWQMSAQTSNGVPSWWNDLRQVSTNSFVSSSPQVTFTNSGFSGLDGTYYANTDGANFVLVETSGAYGIYFSNSATAPSVCLSNARMVDEETEQTELMNYDVSVYPNPSNGSFNLRMPKLENVESIILFNALGQKMEELNLAKYSNGEISFGESLKKGFYLLNVVINGKKQTMPIIKN